MTTHAGEATEPGQCMRGFARTNAAHTQRGHLRGLPVDTPHLGLRVGCTHSLSSLRGMGDRGHRPLGESRGRGDGISGSARKVALKQLASDGMSAPHSAGRVAKGRGGKGARVRRSMRARRGLIAPSRVVFGASAAFFPNNDAASHTVSPCLAPG